MSNHKESANRPYVVCTRCEGEGKIGPGHVYTQEDRDEYDAEEFADLMAEYRMGLFDVTCPKCDGKRVTRAECACIECEGDRREIAEMEAMERAERAFGC